MEKKVLPNVAIHRPPDAYRNIDIEWHQLDLARFCFFNAVVTTSVRAVVYPAALLKTRLQMQTHTTGSQGTWGELKRIVSREGPIGLYRGFSVHAAAAIPIQIVSMMVYEVTKQRMSYLCNETTHFQMTAFRRDMWCNVIAGAMSSITALTIIVPTDIITQKLMVQSQTTSPIVQSSINVRSLPTWSLVPSSKVSVPHASVKAEHPPSAQFYQKQIINDTCLLSGAQSQSDTMRARDIVRSMIGPESGLLGLYRGFVASFWTYVPQAGVWWATYGFAKRALIEATQPLPHKTISLELMDPLYGNNLPIQAAAGGLAGVVSIIASHPFDVLKTRIQTQKNDTGRAIPLRKAFSDLVASDGIKGLGKGLNARLMNGAPSSMLMIISYELVKSLSTT